MSALKYGDLLARNRELAGKVVGPKYAIRVLSNVIVAQLSEVLEFEMRTSGINAYVQSGQYDNVVQESTASREANLVILFWELCALLEGFHYKANLMPPKALDELLDKVEQDIGFVLKALETCPLVILNRFSSTVFTHRTLRKTALERAAERLNAFVEKNCPANLVIVDTDKVLCDLSVKQGVDSRTFYSSKAPYTVAFFRAYSAHVAPVILSVLGRSKKALILDCDQTLWKGVVGEDGLSGIEMSTRSKDGTCFHEVQHLFLELARRGVILGLCSKNNPEDIQDVLDNHPDMVLKDEHLVIKKVNWNDKSENLRRIAAELNIGLDAIVFLDDSDFEVELVRQQIPDIKLLLVPKILSEYPSYVRDHLNLFYAVSEAAEDGERTQMYKKQQLREVERAGYGDVDDYLRSLCLRVDVFINDAALVPRIAQLTQKTNQFNLTTKRYTESEIRAFWESGNAEVFALGVADNYGDYGITGVCIATPIGEKGLIDIDTFLLSCRVLGRNIEQAFFSFLLKHLTDRGFSTLSATYRPTNKNRQTKDFYDKAGLGIVAHSESEKRYQSAIRDVNTTPVGYIEVRYGRANRAS